MAKKTRKRRKSGAAQGQGTAQTGGPSRRMTLRQIATFGIGGAVLLGGGGVFAMDFRKKLQEQDLSVIGQGTPVLLQIHDPQCPNCTALQRQTRRALKSFDEGEILYRVANIQTPDGLARQRMEALPTVTLALFDGAGTRVHVIEGVTPADDLVAAFRRYLAPPGS